MHWADVQAKKLAEEADKHVLATAITPSGPIHIGNLREVLTTEAVYRALRDNSGIDAELIYIGDTFDPLRRVYPFLPSYYEKYIGMPLSEIPCPCEKHESYAAHFLEPFLSNLEEIGVKPHVYLAHKMYKDGTYKETIKIALDNTQKIRTIMKNVAKRELPDTWMPFNVKCECGRLDGEITNYDYPYASYRCKSCGCEGNVDLRIGGVGKLPWRVDWPARWKILDVTFEAFGKDHAAAGSSWDTGKEIVLSVYNRKPPIDLFYEFIHLKGRGAMHGSTGTAIAAEEMLNITPPEVLRFLLMKCEPFRHIEFDSGLGLLDLVDEYDKYERIVFEAKKQWKHNQKIIAKKIPKEIDLTRFFLPVGDERETKISSRIHDYIFIDNQTIIELSSEGNAAKAVIHEFADIERIYELSQPYPKKIPKELPVQIPYRHLVTLVQIAGNWEGVFKILKRNEEIEKLNEHEEKKLRERLTKARYWLQHFAPNQVKFEVKKKLPKIRLTSEQKRFLFSLRNALSQVKWNPENIHMVIYSVAGEWEQEGKQKAVSEGFRIIYQIFLGQNKGPRAGYFIHSLGKEFILKRLDEAIEKTIS